MTTRIGVFLPWWGPQPSWVPDFLDRAEYVLSLVPILVGDAAQWEPGRDLRRVACTMDEFEARASVLAGRTIRKDDPAYPRGQCVCELRPLLADMYPDVIADFEWWGYGDWDVVWGDWDGFLSRNADLLSKYDAISTNPKCVNGPLMLWRNCETVNRLYQRRADLLITPLCSGHLDEPGIDYVLRQEMSRGNLRGKYLQSANGNDSEVVWNRCGLIGNKLHEMTEQGDIGREILKFHFSRSDQWPLRQKVVL